MGRKPESLSIEAYKHSFAGNPWLGSDKINNFRPTVISCFVAGATVLFVSLACYIHVEYKPRNQDRPIKRQASWDMKRFHVLSVSEEEIVKAINKENLTGKGGSGNVYKVTLASGRKQLAVKHIWKSDSGNQRSCRSSIVMLTVGTKITVAVWQFPRACGLRS